MDILALASDALLIGATLGLAAWCRALSLRLRASDPSIPSRAVADAEAGIAVEDLEARLSKLEAAIARGAVELGARTAAVEAMNRQADDRIGQMEMLLASLEELQLQDPEASERENAGAAVLAMPSFKASRSPTLQGVSR